MAQGIGRDFRQRRRRQDHLDRGARRGLAQRARRSWSSTSTSACAISTSCMGAERRVVFDLINVTQGDAKLPGADPRQADRQPLSAPRLADPRQGRADRRGRRARHRRTARAASTGSSATAPPASSAARLLAMRFADVAIVVANPEVSSVRDTDRIIGMLDSKTRAAPSSGERWRSICC